MNLIDADKLLRLLDYDMYYTSIFIKRSIRDKEECNYLQLCGQRSTLTNCYDMVKNQPTAFNVDKVVEQLETRRKEYEDKIDNLDTPFRYICYYKGMMRGYEYSKDIVKAGGV